MALKLLTRKDTLLKNEEMGLEMRLGNLLPEDVAEMQGLRATSHNVGIAIAIYALRHCITELFIQGEEYQPRHLSVHVDLNDAESIAALQGVAALVIEEALVSDELKKKFQKQRATRLQKAAAAVESTAETAPTSTKG